MPGGVGRGGEKPPLTRLGLSVCQFQVGIPFNDCLKFHFVARTHKNTIKTVNQLYFTLSIATEFMSLYLPQYSS